MILTNNIATAFPCSHRPQTDPNRQTRFHFRRPVRSAASNGVHWERKGDKHRSICTADELHRVSVSNSDWKLALWRYLPSPKSSFARYMSAQGFDTWTLELRGAGLSTKGDSLVEDEECLKNLYGIDSAINDELVTKSEEVRPTTRLMEIFTRASDRLAGFLHGDLSKGRQNSAVVSQVKDFNQRLRTIFEGQKFFPAPILELQDRFTATLEEFQEQLELIVKYDWDFDHYLEEDIPAAMEYIRAQCQPRDGKLLAIGHSMGGILLYAKLSRSCFDGKDSQLASVVTLGSSLDYTPSRSSLKLLLPLAKPAQALNIPVVPLGPLMATTYPLTNSAPFALSWLISQISAQDMMDQKLLEKLVMNNFCTVPCKLLLQLKTAFYKGGLRDRSGTFFYKDHLHKSKVPVLAVAGDQDLICPPEAVYETVKLIPEELVTYKVFGESGGPHYAHYDLVGGRLAAEQLYPCITEFLIHHDMAPV
ncbi:uncharacterized protein LOC130738837 isoform X2 [Lotus japonicus]|uniref:uncharacterized protein LOC130738837 isoform X2 n=1 Tax=Lotus japonicus TaxID=34305 RepID=UPI0025884750|nr:uncharacterized protein LOC130738837 isoform X2 [Lotus japonicus]